MWKPVRSSLIRYLLPFGAIVGALLTQAAVALVVPKGFDFPYAFFYLIAVFVVAWFGGYAPGAIACTLTMVGLPLATTHSFRLSSIDPSRVIIFIAISLLISKVSRDQQRARKMLRSANDELELRVNSRTRDLAQAVESLESEVAQRKKTEEKLQTQLGHLSLARTRSRASSASGRICGAFFRSSYERWKTACRSISPASAFTIRSRRS